MFENAFGKMCVLICGRFSIDDILLFGVIMKSFLLKLRFVFFRDKSDIRNFL